MLLVAMVLLLACTRLLPGKGTNALPGKGILFAALVLALAMAVPGEGILGFILAMAVPAQGWRLRELGGQLRFVWPSGYWEQVGSFWEEAIDAFFQTEPKMAAYIAAVSVTGSNEVSEYPPTWHQQSGMWAVSRREPEARLHVVARAEDMDQWSTNLFDGRWAGDTEQEAPGNWAPVTAAQPAHHQEGNQHVWTDGSSIHVWREPGQGYDQGSGSSSWRDQPGQGSWDQPGQGSWDQPGQGPWQEWRGSSWSCNPGWSQHYNQYGRREQAPPPPGPPNPERYFTRGVGSQQKREQKRRLEREGKPVPSELLPQKQSLKKAIKQQMWLLTRWARQPEEATSAEDLDDIAQELQKLQAEEASRLQSLRKVDGGTVPARRQYVGKHRSQSVQPEKGESKGAAKGDSCASAGPPQDGKAEPEKRQKTK